jgi:hypothetical protein
MLVLTALVPGAQAGPLAVAAWITAAAVAYRAQDV